jgi:hypothetical protein
MPVQLAAVNTLMAEDAAEMGNRKGPLTFWPKINQL